MVCAFISDLKFNYFKLIKNFKFQISNSRGITLIELVVVIFIISLFSLMAFSNFPKILREYALSKVTYKLSQDLRSVQDLSLSGVTLTDWGGCLVPVKGYGVYFNQNYPNQYAIYADVNDDKKYSINNDFTLCEKKQYYSGETGNGVNDGHIILTEDCVMQIVYLATDDSSLAIERIVDSSNASYDSASINFNPPNPTTTLTATAGATPDEVEVYFRNGDGSERSVKVSKSGLISVQ